LIAGVTILGVLDEEDHQKGDDRRSRIDARATIPSIEVSDFGKLVIIDQNVLAILSHIKGRH
jgi:hypothetical protein